MENAIALGSLTAFFGIAFIILGVIGFAATRNGEDYDWLFGFECSIAGLGFLIFSVLLYARVVQ